MLCFLNPSPGQQSLVSQLPWDLQKNLAPWSFLAPSAWRPHHCSALEGCCEQDGSSRGCVDSCSARHTLHCLPLGTHLARDMLPHTVPLTLPPFPTPQNFPGNWRSWGQPVTFLMLAACHGVACVTGTCVPPGKIREHTPPMHMQGSYRHTRHTLVPCSGMWLRLPGEGRVGTGWNLCGNQNSLPLGSHCPCRSWSGPVAADDCEALCPLGVGVLSPAAPELHLLCVLLPHLPWLGHGSQHCH